MKPSDISFSDAMSVVGNRYYAMQTEIDRLQMAEKVTITFGK